VLCRADLQLHLPLDQPVGVVHQTSTSAGCAPARRSRSPASSSGNAPSPTEASTLRSGCTRCAASAPGSASPWWTVRWRSGRCSAHRWVEPGHPHLHRACRPDDVSRPSAARVAGHHALAGPAGTVVAGNRAPSSSVSSWRICWRRYRPGTARPRHRRARPASARCRPRCLPRREWSSTSAANRMHVDESRCSPASMDVRDRVASLPRSTTATIPGRRLRDRPTSASAWRCDRPRPRASCRSRTRQDQLPRDDRDHPRAPVRRRGGTTTIGAVGIEGDISRSLAALGDAWPGRFPVVPAPARSASCSTTAGRGAATTFPLVPQRWWRHPGRAGPRDIVLGRQRRGKMWMARSTPPMRQPLLISNGLSTMGFALPGALPRTWCTRTARCWPRSATARS